MHTQNAHTYTHTKCTHVHTHTQNAHAYMHTQNAHTYVHTHIHNTSECKTLWGEPERVHRISAVNIQDECTV